MTSPMMEHSVLGLKWPNWSQIDNDEKPSGKKGKTKKAKPKAPPAALPPAKPSAGTPSTSAPTSAPLRALSNDASDEDFLQKVLTNAQKRKEKRAAPLPAAEPPMGQAAKITTVAVAKPAEAIAATLPDTTPPPVEPDDELKKTAAARISEAIRSSSLEDTLELLKQKRILQPGKVNWHRDQDTGDINCYLYIDQKKLKSSDTRVVLNLEIPLADGYPNVKVAASIYPDSNHVGARKGSFNRTDASGYFSLKAELPADLRDDVATCSVQFSLVDRTGNLEYGPAQEHNFVATPIFKDRKIWDFKPFFEQGRKAIGVLGFLKISRILKIPIHSIESGRSGLGNAGLGLGSLPISEMPALPPVPDVEWRVKNTFLEPVLVGSEPPPRHRSLSHGDLQQLEMDEAFVQRARRLGAKASESALSLGVTDFE